MKVNEDGNSLGNPSGKAGCGGLLRIHLTWGNGFWDFLYIGLSTNLYVELYAIREGLILAWSCEFRRLELKLDSLTVVNLLNDKCEIVHPYYAIIIDIQTCRVDNGSVLLSTCFERGTLGRQTCKEGSNVSRSRT